MSRIRSFLLFFAVTILFVLGAIAYTWPGPQALWEGRTDIFMSDGTDLTTNAFQFDMLHRSYLRDPTLFLFGAYPNQRLNAPEGYVAWYSLMEKIAGALFPFFVPAEQVCVLLALVLMILNALSFYGMGRVFGWHRFLALALAIAWAFSAYTRARAQVHVGLVGIYGLPLAVLGLLILQKDKSAKGIFKSALCFLGSVTSAHYYIIFLAMFSPFLLLLYISDQMVRKNIGAHFLALFKAALPAVIFLGVSFIKPVPLEFTRHVASVLPTTGQSNVWPHPFLKTFSANFVDYFSGDIAIGTNDINPLRASLTLEVREALRVGNFHEHALGIRWVVWLLFILSCWYMFKKRLLLSPRKYESSVLIVIFAFGLFAFLGSLSPDWGLIWGPSAWIHWAVEQVRVPNRSGIYSYFCILTFVGIVLQVWFLESKRSYRTRLVFMGLLPVLIVADFPPFMNPMPMAPIVASREVLFARKSGDCGMGYHFPHVSGDFEALRFYYLLQSLRGTDCLILNPATPSRRDQRLAQLYGYRNTAMLEKVVQNDPSVRDHLVEFARCHKLDWLVFDPGVPVQFVQDVCKSWGGHLVSPDLCRSHAPLQRVSPGLPDECLAKFQ